MLRIKLAHVLGSGRFYYLLEIWGDSDLYLPAGATRVCKL